MAFTFLKAEIKKTSCKIGDHMNEGMKINYDKVIKLNSFHGVVLRGNETFDELLEIEQDRKKRIKYLMTQINDLNHDDIKSDILLNVFEHLTEDQLDTIEARALKETKQDNKENNPVETNKDRRKRIAEEDKHIQTIDNQTKR